jgi:hypothetical protein
MVRIGGKALNGQTNWAAMTHEQLYAAVVGGNEPSVVYGVSDKWISLGNNMLDSAVNLHQQVASTSSGWQGEAAESARNAVGQLVGWSGKAAQTAQFMGHQLNQQGQVMETAKNNMPGPVDFDVKTAALVEPGLSGFANSMMDTQAGQQVAAEAHARAIDVATTMEQNSTQIDQATPEFEPVPTVISPNQIGTLTPMLHGTPMQPGATLSPTESIPVQPFQSVNQSPGNGSPAQPFGTQQPPTTGAPGTSQTDPGGSSSTQAQSYQGPPASSPNYQPNAPYNSPSPGYVSHQQPVNSVPTGTGPGSISPADIYAKPSGSTTTSGYPGGSGPGPQTGPAWPTGGNPYSGGPSGGNPYGGPGGSNPYGGPGGGGPFGNEPFGSIPPGENIPGGGGGAGGAGGDSIRGYQPGAISSRLGSAEGTAGARANAGASGAAAAAEAEGEAGGAGSLGAAGRAGSSSGMPGGMGSGGSKRKEDDKEHKSAGYVEGEEIFEPLGGELPPSVIGERRTRPAK